MQYRHERREVVPKRDHDPAFRENGKLTDPRFELYARVYAQTFDANEACRAINLDEGTRGNFKDTRYNLLRTHPEINERIRDIIEERAKDLCLDENWVVMRLIGVLERALEAEAQVDREGEPTGKFLFDGRTATKILEMLGDKLGMFDKKGAQQTGGITINMNYGSDRSPIKIAPGVTVEG